MNTKQKIDILEHEILCLKREIEDLRRELGRQKQKLPKIEPDPRVMTPEACRGKLFGGHEKR